MFKEKTQSCLSNTHVAQFGWLRCIQRTVVIVAALSFFNVANAGVIYSSTQTGQQLSVNSAVTFLDGSQSVNGQSLDLNPDGPFQSLLRWDLLSAGDRGDLVFDIAIDYDPLSADNDPRFMITDGDNAFALVRSDNASGRVGFSWGSISTGAYVAEGNELLTTGLGNVQPFSYAIFVPDDGVGSFLSDYQEGSFSQTGNTEILGNFLNTDNQISFYIAGGNSGGENYRINSISVEITAVPAPMPIGLLAFGLIGLIAKRKMRMSAHR